MDPSNTRTNSHARRPMPTTEAGPLQPAWRDPVFEELAYWHGGEFAIRACGTTYADVNTHAMWCLYRDGRASGQRDITRGSP
jgi:hypothetical protein